ncbi:MAG: T9SS type A sorting domain-containing protein [Bacteroidota bacterium]|nr:T9SS type A sorting domain-containing protein [Bacteroidota bacterium]
MKKTIFTLILFVITIANLYAQWKNIPINLSTIYLHSVNDDNILVKVNNNDCFRLEKNENEWMPINTNFIQENSGIRSIHQNKNLILLLENLTNSPIYVSEDAGKSFQKLETITNASKFNKAIFNYQSNRIYVGANEGVRLQYSDDIGKTWVADTLGIFFLQYHSPSKIYNLDSMEIQESNTGIYYRNAYKNEIWKHFAHKINGLPITTYELEKHRESILVSTSDGIFKFQGLDSPWTRYGINTPIKFVHSMQSIGRYLFINQSSKGIYMSGDDGNTWDYLNLDTNQNTDFRMSMFNNKIVAFTNTGVYTLDTNNFVWENLGNNLSAVSIGDIGKVNNDIYISSYWFGITQASLDGQYKHIIPKHNTKKVFIRESNIFTSSNKGVFWKEISDTVWKELHPLLKDKSFIQSTLSHDTLYYLNQLECMAKPIKDTNCIQIGSGLKDNSITDLIHFNGNLYALSRHSIYILNRLTGNWETEEHNLFDEIFNAACIFNHKLIVATNKGLFYLNDSNNAWEPVLNTQNLGNISAVHAVNNKLIWYASSEEGVYFCEGLNTPFYPVSGQLPNMSVSKLYTHQDTIYLGGSKGVWFRPLEELKSSMGHINKTNDNITIFPNPATTEITIISENARQGKILLMDILGRPILETHTQSKKETLHIAHIPTGIYFLVIQQNSKSFTRKIVIER